MSIKKIGYFAMITHMNTQPDAIKVLCYGDSNTWGQRPDSKLRYAADIRWTGILQQNLGTAYYIVEEGLNSRTTDLEFSGKPGRNGKTYLTPCLASHNPIDIVVVMLGTNDLKIEFNRSPQQIATAIAGLVDDIKNTAWDNQQAIPQIVIVSPIHIDNHAAAFGASSPKKNYDAASAVKSQQLASEIEQVAAQHTCHYIDAATVAKAGIDGIHFTEESHHDLGALLATKIKSFAA